MHISFKGMGLAVWIRNYPGYLRDYRALKSKIGDGQTEFPFGRWYPCLEDKFLEIGVASGHYFHQDLLVANKIFRHNPKKHVDIGSRMDGFIAHVASFREIEVFDIRDLKNRITNVVFKHGDLMDVNFSTADYCDSISCLHALEHFGLGRYGDRIDVDGHLLGWKNISKMLKQGGKFYFSVPIGEQRIEFNAHRVFSLKYLLNLMADEYTIDGFSYVNDRGALVENAELTPEMVDRNFDCHYGCGIFELTKISRPQSNYFKLNHFFHYSARPKFSPLKTVSPQTYLAKAKREQRGTYDNLKHLFREQYEALKKFDIRQFTVPIWEHYIKGLEKVFLPHPPFFFLRDPIVSHTMFVDAGGNWFRREISYLESKYDQKELQFLLQEDLVGGPRRLYPQYVTSHNSVHHLYHLTRFRESTGADFETMNTIIEWGGGYGNLMKILARLKQGKGTYIIIDLPLFSCLQWLYLSTVFGPQYVNLISSPATAIVPDIINLLPLGLLNDMELKGDLFISSWGLSESSVYSQDYVVERNWFGSEHILLAYQESDQDTPNSDLIGKMAAESGAMIEDIEFLTGQHYAFR